MLKNYLKVAIRNLIKQKYFTIINIIGLALGIAASALIFLWVSYELSYDKFHDNSENIYRVTVDASLGGSDLEGCLVAAPLAQRFKDFNPEVLKTAAITQYIHRIFKYGDNTFKEKKVINADSNLFKLFNFTFLEGNPNRPFEGRSSVVLTKSVAEKYFGEEKALGKSIIVDNDKKALIVSAVIEDFPSNSHMQFSIIMNRDYSKFENWGALNRYVYVKFIDDFSEANALSILKEIVYDDMVPVISGFIGIDADQFISSGNSIQFGLQPLEKIHLHSNYHDELDTNGKYTYVLFFSIIAFLILLIACINYMNLSRAYYETRIVEVGIRKTNGAKPGMLLVQFLVESVLISVVACALGLVILYITLPIFTNHFAIIIDNAFVKSWQFISLLFLIVLSLGTFSILYPSLYLSRYKITSIFRNKIKSSHKSAFNTRAVLVVLQFSVTIIVIVATILVKKQVSFMVNKDLGFNKEQLIVIEGAKVLGKAKNSFKNELKKNANIINTCYSTNFPGNNLGVSAFGIKEHGPDLNYTMKMAFVGPEYFDTYGLKVLKGRSFKESDKNAAVLNESAVKQIKIKDDPLSYTIFGGATRTFPIVGVIEDYYHEPLVNSIDPMLIALVDISRLNDITIRISGKNTKETISYINDKWNDLTNNKAFEFQFLDEKMQKAYDAEMRMGKVFSMFSILSIFIACIGILGMASFLLQRRVKEIAIRRVNGSTIREVMVLLTKDYIKWIAISFLIATPIGYYIMHKWLQNFAYRTEINWWVFALAGLMALAIALIAVSWQTWRAASRNPVESLRYE